MLVIASPATSATISARCRQFSRRGRALNASSAGATIRSPAALPSHHVRHIDQNDDHGCSPLAQKLVAPIVALIAVLASAPNTTTASIPRSQLWDIGVATN